MKTLAFSFLMAMTASIAISGCASNSDDFSGGPVSYPDPDRLDTQESIQQMHSDALRQEF